MKKSIALLLAVTCSAAFAGLGEAAGAAPSPLAAAPGRTVIPDVYMASSVTGGGTEVHQYSNRAGIVFAVAWSGPELPDLRELLGPRFGTLLARPGELHGRPRLRLHTSDLVVVSGGRMGEFEGKAWVPALLPAGFPLTDIR